MATAARRQPDSPLGNVPSTRRRCTCAGSRPRAAGVRRMRSRITEIPSRIAIHCQRSRSRQLREKAGDRAGRPLPLRPRKFPGLLGATTGKNSFPCGQGTRCGRACTAERCTDHSGESVRDSLTWPCGRRCAPNGAPRRTPQGHTQRTPQTDLHTNAIKKRLLLIAARQF